MKKFIEYIWNYKDNSKRLDKHADLLKRANKLNNMLNKLNTFMYWSDHGHCYHPGVLKAVKWISKDLAESEGPERLYPNVKGLEEIGESAAVADKICEARARIWPNSEQRLKHTLSELIELQKTFSRLCDFEAVAAIYMELSERTAKEHKVSAATAKEILELIQFMKSSMQKD